MVKTLIIFKGLKNVPKLNLPPGIEVTVSKGRLNEYWDYAKVD